MKKFYILCVEEPGPEVIKLLFMLNSTEHEISTHKILKINDFSNSCIYSANKC